jgi:hypothetical protein
MASKLKRYAMTIQKKYEHDESPSNDEPLPNDEPSPEEVLHPAEEAPQQAAVDDVETDEFDDNDDERGSMSLAAVVIVLVWAVTGGFVAWLCSSIWPRSVHGFPVTFVGACGAYVVVSMVIAVIAIGWVKSS